MRAVKKILWLLLMCAAARVQAQPAPKILLECTGWLPAYEVWETQAMPAGAQDGRLNLEIDRAAGTLATRLAQAGELSARLEVSPRAYAGTAPLGRVVLNRSLDAVEISVDRLSGDARLRYLVGETSFPAFVGKCGAARPH